MTNDGEFEVLLKRCREGEREACEEVFGRIYAELRRMARRYMRSERPGHTLQPTELVNEVFLRVLAGKPVDWQNRSHVLGAMANRMRQILVDYARRRHAKKRGDVRIELPQDLAAAASPFEELLTVNAALEELSAQQPIQAQIAELRVFVGMNFEEIADAVGKSESTVKREWDLAKAWLRRRIGRDSLRAPAE